MIAYDMLGTLPSTLNAMSNLIRTTQGDVDSLLVSSLEIMKLNQEVK